MCVCVCLCMYVCVCVCVSNIFSFILIYNLIISSACYILSFRFILFSLFWLLLYIFSYFSPASPSWQLHFHHTIFYKKFQLFYNLIIKFLCFFIFLLSTSFFFPSLTSPSWPLYFHQTMYSKGLRTSCTLSCMCSSSRSGRHARTPSRRMWHERIICQLWCHG